MATKQNETMDEDTEDKSATYGKESSKESSNENEAKVPEEFQKEAMALVQSCKTVACLDFLSSEVSEMRQKLMSSQKKAGLNRDDFSEEGMPELG